MKQVKLRCGVYGEGTVFSVEIASNAEVEELQSAIAERYKIVSNREEVFPATLTLYVAKKKEGNEDKWLKHDYNVEDLLSGEVDITYKKMLSSWKLNKEDLLGPNFSAWVVCLVWCCKTLKQIHNICSCPHAIVVLSTIALCWCLSIPRSIRRPRSFRL